MDSYDGQPQLELTAAIGFAIAVPGLKIPLSDPASPEDASAAVQRLVKAGTLAVGLIKALRLVERIGLQLEVKLSLSRDVVSQGDIASGNGDPQQRIGLMDGVDDLFEHNRLSRDNRTAIELFRLGLDGWDAVLRRRMDGGKSN